MKHEVQAHRETTKDQQATPSAAPEKAKGFTRRTFLKVGAGVLATGGLAVAIAYPRRYAILFGLMEYMENRHFDPRSFILIPTTGPIQLVCHRSEMGQGVRTALPMLLAEELDVPWEEIQVVQALGDPRYGSQNTDGSKSIRDFYTLLRKAAAGTREVLTQAAANQWKVPVSECVAKQGKIHHTPTKRTLTYGAVAQDASQLTLPKRPTLKAQKDFTIIGKPRKGVDVPAMAQGKAQYGADIDLPGLVYACAARAPIPGAKIKSFDDTAAKQIKGVLRTATIDAIPAPVNSNAAVCVVATNTWAAIQGQRALKIQWDTQGLKLDSSPAYRKELEAALEKADIVHRSEGDPRRVEAESKRKIKRTYHTPYLVHATMEPLVSTAHVKKDGTCEVWAPCQDPIRAKNAIAKQLKISEDKITFHITFLGGGFGRKSQPDFVLESVLLSQKIGLPVRLQWTREDDTKHGFYHAESLQSLSAALDEQGMPISWHHRAVYPTLVNTLWTGNDSPMVFELNMGALNMPYRIPNVLCEAGRTKTALHIGWLRSVCNVFHAFAVNSFVDELAHEARIDPIAYRFKLLGAPREIPSNLEIHYTQDTKRLATVIQKTRDAFGWDKPLPKGHGKGFANHFSFYSYVALALEVRVQDGIAHVLRAVCTIDCGLAVNPDGVRAQMEGSIIFGLSAALYGKITQQDSVIQQSNFHDYPILRMPETPQIEIHILNGAPNDPTGVGEPGVPVVAPALASAIFDATGIRVRDLPIAEKLLTK